MALCAAGVFAADTNVFLDAWIAEQAKVKTWTAEFTQTRQVQTLKQPLRSKGRIAFEAPNRFRWELGQPAQTIAVRGSNEMLVLYPRLKQAERYPLAGEGNEPWRDALALMDAGFAQSRAELEERFALASIAETNGVAEVRLTPKSSRAKRFLSEVVLSVRTNTFEMVANEMRFADGTRLRNDFTNAVKNAELPAGTFAPEIGSEFKVVEPGKQ